MPTVLITGGTGLVGKSLSEKLLQKNYEVVVVSRKTPAENRPPSDGRIKMTAWDLEKQTMDAEAIRSADYIVHLAGASVAEKRWTTKRKKEILESRTTSSELIVKTLQKVPNKVKAVISASAIGWYGRDPAIRPATGFFETDKPDTDFLGETCRRWEESITPVIGLDKRLVILRTGIVLSNQGGALQEFAKPLRFNFATILGSGEQVISWIHLDDLCRIFMEALENKDFRGVYNAVAPNPVTNKELTLELAHALKGKQFIPIHVPAFALKIILGEMSIEVLKSCTVSSDKIKNTGFQFEFPAIESALKDLTDRGG
jgi:hypothetical protein